MKIAYYHEKDLTLAYDLDSLEGSYGFLKNEWVDVNIGSATRHPKDPPNRKIGNQVALGRISTCSMRVHEVSELPEGVYLILKTMLGELTLYCFKPHENKNFYIRGYDLV